MPHATRADRTGNGAAASPAITATAPPPPHRMRTSLFISVLPVLLLLLSTQLSSVIKSALTAHASFATAPVRDAHAASCAVPAVPPLPQADRPINLSHARPTVFFTDGSNFDDILTLLYLLKSPALTPVAIYVGANAWANAAPSRRIFRDVLHLFGARYASVPIAVGSFFALADERAAVKNGLPNVVTAHYRAPVPHGASGILRCDDAFGTARHLPPAPPDADVSVAEDDREALHMLASALAPYADGDVLFLVTGTLTPVAKLLAVADEAGEADPSSVAKAEDVLRKLHSLFMMGGAVHARGNLYTLPANNRAEFNVFNDPHAADAALRRLAVRGKPATLVPLDATGHVPFTQEFCSSMEGAAERWHGRANSTASAAATTAKAPTPELQYAGLLIRRLRESWEGEAGFFDAAFLWDVTAAVVLARPGVVLKKSTVQLRVVFEQGLHGPEQGWTKPCEMHEVEDDRCYPVEVVHTVDGPAVREEVLERMSSGSNSAERSLVCG